MQFAQVPGRGEPDSEGEINYEYICKLLEEEGYGGKWVGLEYFPVDKTSTENGLGWINKFGYDVGNVVVE